jgi:hypothetical protein
MTDECNTSNQHSANVSKHMKGAPKKCELIRTKSKYANFGKSCTSRNQRALRRLEGKTKNKNNSHHNTGGTRATPRTSTTTENNNKQNTFCRSRKILMLKK